MSDGLANLLRRMKLKGCLITAVVGVALVVAGFLVAGYFFLESFDVGPEKNKYCQALASGSSAHSHAPIFASRKERLAFFDLYVKSFSKVTDVQFHINDTNLCGGLPGPTNRDYRLLLRTSPQDTGKWTSGMDAMSNRPADLDWATGLLAENPDWQTTAAPEYFVRPGGRPSRGATAILYRHDGIVLKRFFSY